MTFPTNPKEGDLHHDGQGNNSIGLDFVFHNNAWVRRESVISAVNHITGQSYITAGRGSRLRAARHMIRVRAALATSQAVYLYFGFKEKGQVFDWRVRNRVQGFAHYVNWSSGGQTTNDFLRSQNVQISGIALSNDQNDNRCDPHKHQDVDLTILNAGDGFCSVHWDFYQTGQTGDNLRHYSTLGEIRCDIQDIDNVRIYTESGNLDYASMVAEYW